MAVDHLDYGHGSHEKDYDLSYWRQLLGNDFVDMGAHSARQGNEGPENCGRCEGDGGLVEAKYVLEGDEYIGQDENNDQSARFVCAFMI
ncbi:MAG: hypothetical protein WCQ50_01455 [Spirochaetota bacterium]